MYSHEEVKKLVEKAFNNNVIDGKEYIQKKMPLILSSKNYIIDTYSVVGEVISWKDEELDGIYLYVKGNYMTIL